MGKKRGERGKALILRNEAANDIGDDAATDAIIAVGSESVFGIFRKRFLVWVYPDIVLFFIFGIFKKIGPVY